MKTLQHQMDNIMAIVKLVELENGQWVYMQVDESITLPTPPAQHGGYERKGGGSPPKIITKLSDMIRAMTETTANAVQNSTLGSVDKVTLEFSVTLGGELAIPLVTSGKAEGSVNVTVEFTPKKEAV
ncbi:MAG: hypothetical protein L3K52_09680 [Candidatus Thiothrix sulfatifontis]|nr:MAG: hypothetical protein L3K52_09680 [Candidatus Thiothrix sulfatifontis]